MTWPYEKKYNIGENDMLLLVAGNGSPKGTLVKLVDCYGREWNLRDVSVVKVVTEVGQLPKVELVVQTPLLSIVQDNNPYRRVP